MPELPEVEVIRRSLAPRLVGRRVTGVEVRQAALRRPVAAAELRRLVAGHRITALERRAKYLLVHLDSRHVLAIHLGMSGRLTVVPRRQPLELHEHLVFHLGRRPAGARGRRDAEDLRFRDPRRFGLVAVLPVDRWRESPLFRHLGPEPLDPDLDAADLWRLARARRAPIKSLLMDARVLVGVGNIYASEALFAAGIDPRRPAGTLGPARWRRLLTAIRRVLDASIADGGTSLADFRDGNGDRGLHRMRLAVYGRSGAPCPRCGRAVRRQVLSGRSTFFCTRCQR